MFIRPRSYSLFFIGIACLIVACSKLAPKAPTVDEVMDAPLEGLTPAQNQLFLKGADEFDENYTAETGLGPYFVATSCGSCHGGDNRGHLFTLLTRFGQDDTTGNKFLKLGGPQLQHKAIPGHTPERIPNGATSTQLIAPIVSGVGFLELVPDADILALADPNDADGDGISGVPNWIHLPSWLVPLPNAQSNQGKYIGRFGHKGSSHNLLQQTVGAFNQDMGITTSFAPNDPLNYLEITNPLPSRTPEVSDEDLNACVYYLQTLQAPLQRTPNNPDVVQGKKIFIQMGCEKCHKENLQTGFSYIDPLSYKVFHAYTDLLLHDMGPGLDDHYTEGSALTSEWKTAPLWGLGLAPNAQGGRYFLLHDGRARSIEDAILLHGGEGAGSADAFQKLSEADKKLLLAFLKSL